MHKKSIKQGLNFLEDNLDRSLGNHGNYMIRLNYYIFPGSRKCEITITSLSVSSNILAIIFCISELCNSWNSKQEIEMFYLGVYNGIIAVSSALTVKCS